MPEFKYESAAESLAPLIDMIDHYGDRVAPRGEMTSEMRHVTIVITNPHDCLMTGINREGYNQRLAALEALQLIAGQQYPQLLAKVAPNTQQFIDGGAFHGAYGPRLRNQIPKIIDQLREDPSSRQAVATIWDPAYDGHGDTSDTPCTVYLSFMVRNERLILHTHMRSNDVWWGWTYDVVQFCQLQVSVAASLGRDAGEYVHYADSLHLYDRDMEQAIKVGFASEDGRDKIYPIIDGNWKWSAHVKTARNMLSGDHPFDGTWLSHQAWRIHNG